MCKNAILEQDGLIQRGWSFIKRIPYKWSVYTQPGYIRTRWSYSEGLVLYKEDPLQVVSVHTAWLSVTSRNMEQGFW